MDGLKGTRTLVLTVTGADDVTFTNTAGTTLAARCTGTTTRVCSFTPAADGTYYVKVTGTVNRLLALSSVDGSTQDLAYTVPAPFTTSATYYKKVNSSSWAKVDLTANTFYGLSVSGATSITVYQGTTQLWTINGNRLNFTPDSSGTYTIMVTGPQNYYALTWWAQGTSTGTPFVLAPSGAQNGSVTSRGYTYFQIDGLNANRTFVLAVTGAGSVSFMTQSGVTQTGTCTGATTKVCSFVPSTSGTWYARVSGTPNAVLTLSPADGSTEERAYTAPVPFTTSATYYKGANNSSWAKVDLTANTGYGLTVPGATSITVYQGATQLWTVDGNALNFTPLNSGTYSIKVTGSAIFFLAWNTTGGAVQSAFDYPVPGDLSRTAASTGTTWFKMDRPKVGRKLVLTVTGASTVNFYYTSPVLQTPALIPTSCTGTTTKVCSFLPTDDTLTYSVKVTGTANAALTLSSVDGSTADLAYTATPPFATSPPYTVPKDGNSWAKVNLVAGTYYGLGVVGATTITLYQGTTQVATANGEHLNITPLLSGTYFIKVTGWAYGTRAYNNYTPHWNKEGESLWTAFPYPAPGAMNGTVTSSGVSWYRMDGLKGNRTFVLTVPGSTAVTFANSVGTAQTASCTGTATRVCSFEPTADGTYYAKVTGTAGANLTLSSQDGSTQAKAYTAPAPFTTSATYSMPATGSSWVQVTLAASTHYGLSVAGATNIAVYQGATQVATVNGSSLSFTSGTAGTYSVQVAGRALATAFALAWTP
jgi:hypothetical protein